MGKKHKITSETLLDWSRQCHDGLDGINAWRFERAAGRVRALEDALRARDAEVSRLLLRLDEKVLAHRVKEEDREATCAHHPI